MIASLQMEFTLVDEGDVASYLRAEISTTKDGHLLLKQPFLIKCIIQALNLTDQHQHDTPTINLLHCVSNGQACKQIVLVLSLSHGDAELLSRTVTP